MIERKSVVNQIEITLDNTVQVQIGLRIVDGGVVVNNRWHRTVLPKGIENGAQLQMNAVNEHLVSMGELPVSQADIDRIVAFNTLAESFG
jgi:hypothetical protein